MNTINSATYLIPKAKPAITNDDNKRAIKTLKTVNEDSVFKSPTLVRSRPKIVKIPREIKPNPESLNPNNPIPINMKRKAGIRIVFFWNGLLNPTSIGDLYPFSNNELATTDTELKAIASPANSGVSLNPGG